MAKVKKVALVLMLDSEDNPSLPLAVSEDIDTLVDKAAEEDFATSMKPLKEIGVSVEILDDGDALRIEVAPKV